MRAAQAMFDQFKAQTGDVSAAAMLTLAAVMLDTKQEKPLGVKDAAERRGVSIDVIYDLCREGKLRHRRTGRRITIDPADLARI
jgi:excisionase family DNA binding protein